MRLLIANPNTSDAITALMAAEAQTVCRPDTEIVAVSARSGVPYIATRAQVAIAVHALLARLAEHAGEVDAVVVGAFCPGTTAAARELLPCPVIGLAEAGLRAAPLFGRRVGIVGIGSRARGMNEEIVRELGMGDHVVSIRRLALTGTAMAADPDAAVAATLAAARRAVKEDDADVLVLGGAAFSGMAARIAPLLPVPVLPPLAYAIGAAECAFHSGWRKPASGAFARENYGEVTDPSAALTGLFAAN